MKHTFEEQRLKAGNICNFTTVYSPNVVMLKSSFWCIATHIQLLSILAVISLEWLLRVSLAIIQLLQLTEMRCLYMPLHAGVLLTIPTELSVCLRHIMHVRIQFLIAPFADHAGSHNLSRAFMTSSFGQQKPNEKERLRHFSKMRLSHGARL